MPKMSYRPTLAFAVLLGLATLTGCDPGISRSKEALERTLKDPGSVQYKDVVSYTEGVVCGEYNAKNSVGGYVGFTKFVTHHNVLVTSALHENYRHLCNNNETGKVELDEVKLEKFNLDASSPKVPGATYWEVRISIYVDRFKTSEVRDAKEAISPIIKEILANNINGDSGWLTMSYDAQLKFSELLKNELNKSKKLPEIKDVSVFSSPARKW